jgi:hypothetical protein
VAVRRYMLGQLCELADLELDVLELEVVDVDAGFDE